MTNRFQTKAAAKIAAVGAAVFLLAGLIYWVRSSIAPGTGSADEGEFLLVEAGERELDGAPALSLTFTLPLDVRQSYDQHIRVFQMPAPPQRPEDRRFPFEVEDRPGKGGTIVSTNAEDTKVEGGTVVGGAWIVGENPRLLHFPHIKPETRYVILVNPGLPARQNGGLPIVTVNVPEVDIQFLRVKNERLSDFLDRVITHRKSKPQQGEEEDSSGSNDDAYDFRRSSLHGAVGFYQLDDFRN